MRVPLAELAISNGLFPGLAGVVKTLAEEIGHWPSHATAVHFAAVLAVELRDGEGVRRYAGALGRPLFLLLPFAADFRWLRGRDDSAWYPTARPLRQPAFGEWDSVVARLCGMLSVEAGAGTGAPLSLT